MDLSVDSRQAIRFVLEIGVVEMPKLTTPPSLLHLVRTWRDSPERTSKALINIARGRPIFSYAPLHVAIREMLVFGVPYHQVVECIRRAEKRTEYAALLLEILPMIQQHLNGVSPEFFQDVAARFYPLAPDIRIPFQPPVVYGTGGQLILPWCIFWRNNPLGGKPLSLFMTLVDEILMEDPDLENASFQLLDFSIPKGEPERQLSIRDGRGIPRLTIAERDEMLSIWAEGFRQARTAVAQMKDEKKDFQEEHDDRRPDPNQGDLFGDDRT
jgi:hypothetical protein